MKILVAWNNRVTLSLRALTLLLVMAFLAVSIHAQNTLTGSTPLGITPGSPSGSYPLSDFESVNLFNGGLNFRLPLLQVAGRGGAGYPITLHLEQKWTVTKHIEPGVGAFYWAEPGWWSEDAGGWRTLDAGRVNIRRGGSTTYYLSCGGYVNHASLSRITFTAPDGTEYELRDQLTGGQPKIPQPCSSGFNRGKNFATADGTTATFVSDIDIIDPYWHGDDETTIPPAAGYLMLRDGTRFRVENGAIKWMRDRNGNKVEFTHDVYNRVVSIKDSLNRLVTVTYATGEVSYDEIRFKGADGQDRTIRLGQAYLWNTLRSDQSAKTDQQLFPELHGTNWAGYLKVVSYIELPNGKRYQLQYNSYAELARVVLPTGGAIEYDYAAGLTDGAASGVFNIPLNKAIYRRVTERRAYPDGGSGAAYTNRITYSRPETIASNLGYVLNDQYNSSGALLGRSQHYFHGSARASFSQKQTEYPAWKDGREYQTDVFDGSGTTVLRRLVNTFAQRAAVGWWTGTAETAPPNDSRLIETVTNIEPGGANLVSKQSFGFDDSVPYNNQNNVKEYDFGVGVAGALLRETRTTFVTASNYTSTDVHLRSLPAQVSVYDAAGVERARATPEYDSYNTAAYHALLVPRSDASGHDTSLGAGFPTRGNVTATTSYLLTNGTVTGSVSSYAQYDILGNVVKGIDAKGYLTEFQFDDRYDVAAEGEARALGGSAELWGLASYAFATKTINAAGHTTFTQFNFYTGQPVDSEDANGIVASSYYDEQLGRPTKVIRAVGTASASQTKFSYDDNGRTITIESDQYAFDDRVLKTLTAYDGFGRTTESRQYEGGANYIVTKQTYDALGRAYQSSNPYRPWQSESAVWTTTNYDALGRVISVATPDSAVVSTYYHGSQILVMDPTGKERMTQNNALGQLTDVWEITPADDATESIAFPNRPEVSAGYRTKYTYDTVGNLTTVAQRKGTAGTLQTRTFVYDSLKRLLSANNPESGTITYTYDNNSNLVTKTDALGRVGTYGYDMLNRNTSIVYTNDPSGTLPVTRSFDLATNGKGRLYQSQTTGANGSLTTIDSYDALGAPTQQRQQFYVSGTWSQSYTILRAYNRAGGVSSQTYPSGHSVTYSYDAAGRVGDKDGSNLAFRGNLGDGVTRTYAAGITYSPFGGIGTERFGADTSLYHKLHYNIRGQLYDVKLSTVNDDQNWNRGAIVNYYSFQPYGFGTSGPDNNGNLLVQQHWIPTDDAISGSSFMQQNYDYDALNRLIWMAEYVDGASASGSQTLGYDRFGNRTNTSAWGIGIDNKAFTVDAANNRVGVPAGQSGTMTYNSVGNLTTDTYSGSAVTREYDGENRIVSETQSAGLAGAYTYDASGQRVRRTVGSTSTWHVYGMGRELLAEYAVNGAAVSPQKEYGYRNGRLLVIAEPNAGNNAVQWLVADQLGTPRIIADKTGSLAGIRRHDYLPFGEELYAGTGNRTITSGYGGDNVRQKFTSYERDNESGLDYAQARYYSSVQGRFTSIDPLIWFGYLKRPQSWNRYSHAINNPLRYVDPDGLKWLQRGNEYAYVHDDDYKADDWKDWNEVLDGSVIKLENARERSEYKTLEGGHVSLNADGTLSAIADPTMQVPPDEYTGFEVGLGVINMGKITDNHGNEGMQVGLSLGVPKFAFKYKGGLGQVPAIDTLDWSAGFCFPFHCAYAGNTLYDDKAGAHPLLRIPALEGGYGNPQASVGITLTGPIPPPRDPYSEMQRKRFHPGYAPHP